MKKFGFALGFMLLINPAFAAEGSHWGYEGEVGPEHWAAISPEFSACSGKNQSPINLTGFIEAELKPIVFKYRAGSEDIVNNGHTVQINAQPGSTISLDGIQFELKQFHFHAPSENQIQSKSFPLEAHLVHADPNGNLAVIAVFFKQGKANPGLAKAWAQLPAAEGDKQTLSASLSPKEILPVNRSYYRFDGSLTTPPCSEGVRWLVMKQPLSASKDQIDAFAHVLHHPNNRPVQAVNARAVLK
jgi:carbonic anhydrase